MISECLTCSMIGMGSSVSYGDDRSEPRPAPCRRTGLCRCPQCGANTTKTYLG